MRMIPKLLTGAVPLHYLHVTVTPLTSGAVLAPSSKESKGEDLISDKIMKYLVEQALPSDATKFAESTNMFGTSLLDGDIRNSPRKFKELMLGLNRMHFEKTLYDNSVTRLKEIVGEGEAAISSSGGVFVLRGDEVKMISVGQLGEGERPLTNALIANIRANSTKYAFNTNLTETLTNATSMKLILDVINNNLKDMQEESMEYNLMFSGRGPEKDNVVTILSSIDIDMNDIASFSPNTLISRKVTDKNNLKLLKSAITSIYNLLDNNMKVLLLLRAKELSEMYGTDVDPLHLILEYASKKAKNERSALLSVQSMPGTDGDSKDPLNKETTIEALTSYATGEGGSKGTVKLTPGNTVLMKTDGIVYGAPMDASNKVIGPSSLTEFLNRGFAPMVDASNGVYFGDQKVYASNFQNVYIDGQLLGRVYLPVTVDELGTEHPNLNLFKKYEEISNKASSKLDLVKLLLSDPELSAYVNPDGTWRSDILRPFLVVSAFASGEADWFGSGFEGVVNPNLVGNGFIFKASDLGEDENALTQSMYRILGTEANPYNLIGDIYKGMVFLPLRRDAVISAMLQSGQSPTITAKNETNANNLSVTDIRNIKSKLNLGQSLSTMVIPNSSKLNGK